MRIPPRPAPPDRVEARLIGAGDHRGFRRTRLVLVHADWLVVPGTARSSLLTGMLGLQPLPTYAEAGVWLIYVIPMLLFVLWPQAQPLGRPASPSVSPSTPG